MTTRKSIARMGTLALPLAGFLMAASNLNAAGLPDSEQVSKLLSEAKTMAFQLKEDAATMESFTRSNVTWQSHAVAITQVKEHINAMERQVAALIGAPLSTLVLEQRFARGTRLRVSARQGSMHFSTR